MTVSMDISQVRVREYDAIEKIAAKLGPVRATAANGPLSIDKRKDYLRRIYYGLVDNTDLLCEALAKDLHRAPAETKLVEIGVVLAELKYALDNIDSWTAPTRTPFDIKMFASNPKLAPEPYGVVLVIGPWNYPFLCLAGPIINAIAAGNCIVAKPSEMVPYSSEAILQVLESALDPSVFVAITGAIPETTRLLQEPFDKICFTGSPPVGRVVSRAAAEHLTPTLLELGGKCPAVIDHTADIALAAKRIAWGKFVNAGQTCVAPDYILIEETVKQQFVDHLKAAIKRMYPNLTKYSSDYAHIVNARLWDRASKLLNSTKGIKELQWGEPDRESLFFPPTIVSVDSGEDPLMKEELFGPILPIVSIQSSPEIVRLIKAHDTPLALYAFTKNQDLMDQLSVIRSGSLFANDVLLQGGSPTVPFGGIGNSGSGAYHGKYGFDAFSHYRPVLNQPGYIEGFLGMRYPPYTPGKQRVIQKAHIPIGVWWSRTGPVRPSLLRRLVGKSWIIVLIFAVFYAKSKL